MSMNSEDVIDLCDTVSLPIDEVLEWHAEVQKMFISYEIMDNSLEFEKMIYDYHQMLKTIDDLKDLATLDVRITSHVEFIYSCMRELQFDLLLLSSEASTHLEIIFVKFITIKIKLYQQRARKLDEASKRLQNSEKPKDRKRIILKNFVQRSLYYLQLFFCAKEKSILHVFIRMTFENFEPNGKEFLIMLINIYMSKWPPGDLSREGFMRGYIIFHMMKEFYPKTRHEEIDNNLYRLYKRPAGEIVTEFKPEFQNSIELVLHMYKPSATLASKYFEYINQKQDECEDITFDKNFLNKISSLQSSVNDNEYANVFGNNSSKGRQNSENIDPNVVPKVEVNDEDEQVIDEVSNRMVESSIANATADDDDDDDDVVIISDSRQENFPPKNIRTTKTSPNKSDEIDLNNFTLPPLPRPPDLTMTALSFAYQQSVTSSSTDQIMNELNNSASTSAACVANVNANTLVTGSNSNSEGSSNIGDIVNENNSNITTTAPVLSPINDNPSEFASTSSETERQTDELLTSTTLDSNETNEQVVNSYEAGINKEPCQMETVYQNSGSIGQISPDSCNNLVDNININELEGLSYNPPDRHNDSNYQSNIVISQVTSLQNIESPSVNLVSCSIANDKNGESVIKNRKSYVFNGNVNNEQTQMDSEALHTGVSTTSDFFYVDQSCEMAAEVVVGNEEVPYRSSIIEDETIEDGSSPQVQEQLIETTTLSDPENEVDIEEHPLSPSSNAPVAEVTASGVANFAINEASTSKSTPRVLYTTYTGVKVNHSNYTDEFLSCVNDVMSEPLDTSKTSNLQVNGIINDFDDDDVEDERSSHVNSPDFNSPEYEPDNGNEFRKFVETETDRRSSASAGTSSPFLTTPTNDLDYASPKTPNDASTSSPPQPKPHLERIILGSNIEIKINLETYDCYGVHLDDEKLTEKTIRIKNDKISAAQMKNFYDINKLSPQYCDKKFKNDLPRDVIAKANINNHRNLSSVSMEKKNNVAILTTNSSKIGFKNINDAPEDWEDSSSDSEIQPAVAAKNTNISSRKADYSDNPETETKTLENKLSFSATAEEAKNFIINSNNRSLKVVIANESHLFPPIVNQTVNQLDPSTSINVSEKYNNHKVNENSGRNLKNGSTSICDHNSTYNKTSLANTSKKEFNLTKTEKNNNLGAFKKEQFGSKSSTESAISKDQPSTSSTDEIRDTELLTIDLVRRNIRNKNRNDEYFSEENRELLSKSGGNRRNYGKKKKT